MSPRLEAAVDIAAPGAVVWAVVSDLRRMGEWSPECVRMRVFGAPRVGAWVIGLNRRRWVMWTTFSRITRYEPERRIAWRVLESGAEWTYEMRPAPLGTRLTERRDLPLAGMHRLSALFARIALGGAAGHDAELLEGMHTTLLRIKAAAEADVPARP